LRALYRLFDGLTSVTFSSVKSGLQGGRFASESVAGIDRNQWPACVGIRSNSKALRLPKEFQFDVPEVEIFRRGDEIIIRKKVHPV